MITISFDPSLRQFCEENNLPPEDAWMLMQVHWRGKVPEHIEDWRYIYDSIVLIMTGELPEYDR